MAPKLRGRVVSTSMQRTVIVLVEGRTPHPKYHRYIKVRTRYPAHDPEEQCNLGDLVELVRTRPLSKTKHHAVARIVEAAEPWRADEILRKRDNRYPVKPQRRIRNLLTAMRNEITSPEIRALMRRRYRQQVALLARSRLTSEGWEGLNRVLRPWTRPDPRDPTYHVPYPKAAYRGTQRSSLVWTPSLCTPAVAYGTAGPWDPAPCPGSSLLRCDPAGNVYLAVTEAPDEGQREPNAPEPRSLALAPPPT